MSDTIPAKHLKFLRAYGKLQPSGSFYYVTIHPLADEREALDRLKMRPEQCFLCDLYWAFGGGLFFISIWGDRTRQPGVKCWIKRGDKLIPRHFLVTTAKAPLTTRDVERALTWLADWLDSAPRRLPTRTRRITDTDIISQRLK